MSQDLATCLSDVISNTPAKRLSATIKRDPVLLCFVNRFPGETLSERIYNAHHNTSSRMCKYGSQKKFRSFTEGYKFCGRANMCKCAAESVSKAVSQAKRNYSQETREKINDKRSKTNLEKYGVSNVGQTVTAKENHKFLYEDKQAVSKIVSQISNTKLKNYGDKNYNNPTQIKETFKSKGVEYWAEKFPDKDIESLHTKDEMQKLFNTKSVNEIADYLNVHIQTVFKYLNKHKITQPFKSIEEKEVVDFIRSLGISNIVENSRSILPDGKELDIYLPDFKLAIEYNGVYWHHDDVSHITRSYHFKKYEMCRSQGIQLITIFSNYWKAKKNIVQKFIKNKIGKTPERVFARKCEVREVPSNETRTFLEENHILGYTPASIRLGLYQDSTLVALMTFGKQRVAIGKPENAHELVRYATSKLVVGGASKLLKAFIRTYDPDKIISYSDNEWSNGNLYNILGFELEKELPPSYWYLKPREERLYHRFTFSKQKLVAKGYSETLTEKEITREMGLLRVWDCGKKRWTMNLRRE